MAAALFARRRARRQRERQRKERIFHQRITLFQMPESDVIKLYRLPSHVILSLLDEIKDDMEPRTKRSHAIPGLTKLLAALHLLSSGSFQRAVTRNVGISQSALSPALSAFLRAMMRRVGQYIHFPQAREEIMETKMDFYAVAGFPNVIGAVDATHVPITPPSEDEHVYLNREQSYSMNIQVVCNARHVINNVVAKYPGSTLDSFVLRRSRLYELMEDREAGRGWLLGDSAYPLLPWLLTPVSNPTTPAEQRYNAAHSKTQNVIERTLRVLKSRFRCLDKTAGSLLYSPSKVCEIVVTCCMLHNLALRSGMPVEVGAEGDDEHLGDGGGLEDGWATQREVIRSYFN